MNKPLIGISLGSSILPSGLFGGNITEENNSWYLTTVNFAQMVLKAGGNPILLPAIDELETSKELWDKLDGVILSGGPDVNPVTYNERNGGKLTPFDNQRDHYELALSKYAVEKNIPVLAICRGLHILNISLGGNIHQDLQDKGYEPHLLHNSKRKEGSHFVDLNEGNLLYDILKKDRIWVNSYHHQGVNELGSGLKAVAFSEDDLVEAVYMPEKKFVIGVQWHPEYMYDDINTEKLAGSFIEAGRR